MQFLEQFVLQLVSPVVGTALIGTAAAVIARRYQDRRLDREVRMNLVSRVSNIVQAIHVELSFYERWVRHSRPSPGEHQSRRAEVDKSFLQHRTNLGVLQTEIDAYFGQASEPGTLLHRLTDLTMLRYAIILALPRSQVMELIAHLGQPGHSGYSVEELQDFMSAPKATGTEIWPPAAVIEKSFTVALRDTVHAVLATRPITSTEGFRSGKLLTAYDQHE